AQTSATQSEPLRLNATSLTLGVKESFALQPVIPSGAGAITFAYTTSNRKVALVSDTGVITAKKKGKATIGVAASTGEQFTCAVTVVKAPKKITLSATSGTLGFDAATGAGTQYRLGVTLPKGTASQISFAGYDPNILTVAADGTITARGLGTTTITASTFNKKKAACKVTVLGAPESIAFADPAPAMIEKEKRTLALTVPQGAVAYARFASDNAAVAAVNAETGEVTALAIGAATITATAFNGRTATCKLTVLPGPDRIELPGTVLLGLGDQALLGAVPVRSDGQATGTGLSYSSSKTKYVAVGQDGTLTGKKKGTAKVTVSAANGVKAVCTVKVVKAPGSIKLSADRRMLQFDAAQGIAEQAKLKVALPKNTASSIAFSGYDAAVVSVSADGTVTPKGLGSTMITATTYNGKKASFKVTVCAPGQTINRNAVNVAHRGGKAYWPENTLEAFRNTASTGATAVELDSRSTKDGVQVVHHDAAFTVNGKKYTIKKLKLAQIKALKPEVCTLDEALDVLAATNLEINLELKDTANAKACVQAIKSRGLQSRTMYISFYSKQLKQVRALDGSTRLGFIINQTPSSLSKTLSGLKSTYVFQKADYLTPENLFAWQDAGLKVGVWTVNDAEGIKKWLSLGVDYITSDYSRLVTEALQ
ncbi:MAG: Ig-like domain-containing protein, partial [Clostridia bacterium]|nr:Ig-like domain-containing protein [Clostridia bacterium]